MHSFFDVDGPLLRTLNKIADLIILNLMFIVCCIPIFTIGAALSAAHYVCLKMVRNEEGYVTKEFFKAFKNNFKQGTLIWLVCLGFILVFGADVYILLEKLIKLNSVFQVLIYAAMVLFTMMMMWLFPMQAKFLNTKWATFKNSFALAMIYFPKTILMALAYALPWALCYVTNLRLLPLAAFFGFSVPFWVSALLYNGTFKKLEANILDRQAAEKKENGEDSDESEPAEDDEKIFSDEPMFSDDESDDK